MTMMDIERIADTLGGKTSKTGGGFFACCPAHDDHNPSLSLDLGGKGKVLFNCLSGCSQSAVMEAMRSRGLWAGGNKATEAEQKEAKTRAMLHMKKIEEKNMKAAVVARLVWGSSTPAKDDHTYLLRKKVKATATMREINLDALKKIVGYTPKCNEAELAPDRILIIPIKVDADISTIEMIDQNGLKSALAHGKKGGGYWAPQELPTNDGEGLTLGIGEGVSTVLSVRAAVVGIRVVACLSCGNFGKVARLFRQRYPKAEIVIIADLGNGQINAEAAAVAISGRLAVPIFGDDRPEKATDMNDLHCLRGLPAVKACIEAATTPDGSAVTSPPSTPPASKDYTHVEFLRGSDVMPEPVTWLWDGWLPKGKVTIFGGAPGTGKTTIAMKLGATQTTGGQWPDGSRATPGNIVIWSGEDDPSDTLIPRLALSGADLSRVYFISDVLEGKDRRSFDPAKDIEPLRRKLTDIGGASLLIIDPIVAAVQGDSHKNAEVRRSLQPLVDLVATMRCALLGITHFSKGTGGRDPVERLTGSLAFGALARVVLVAAKHQEEGEDGRTVRVFLRAKSNIGPDTGGFEYDFHQGELTDYPGVFASSVLWGEAVEGAARELLASADSAGDDGEGGTLADAKRFLSDLLADGPLPAKTIRGDADGAGYSWATIRRAQKALRVEPKKMGGLFGGGKQQWVWFLPDTEGAQGAQAEHLQGETLKVLKNTEDAQQKKVSTFKNTEHLQAADTHGSAMVEVEI